MPAVLVDPEHRHLWNPALEGAGEMRVESDAGRGLTHFAHSVSLEYLKAVALDPHTERGEDVIEDDGLRVFHLDALGELCLGTADGLAQLAALDRQVVKVTSAPG